MASARAPLQQRRQIVSCYERGSFATCSGVPSATISPPPSAARLYKPDASLRTCPSTFLRICCRRRVSLGCLSLTH